jgi:esterase/lipase/carbon monoxide dehydrogenase subunit G
MIEINEEFTVAASPDVVYSVLSDPHAVVECVQGAELGETHEDGTFDSSIVIKFSALRIKFLGRVGLDLHGAERRGTMTASGKDGQGGTKFNVTAEFSVADGSEQGTSFVTTKGDVEIRGKLAGMIEGAASAVTQRMAGEFVAALSLRCASGDTAIAAETVGADTAGTPAPAAVLLHDFGGSPNTLRAWGQALASEGVEVTIPRLPGHGTRWKDLNRTTFDDWLVAARRAVTEAVSSHPAVHVMGLGMGATLALRLASEEGVPIVSVVAVNPVISGLRGVTGWDQAWRWLRRSKPAAADDIRRRGATNTSYRRIPLKAAASLSAGARATADVLTKITVPVRVVASAHNSVVPTEDAAHIGQAVMTASTVIAERSGHVVPLDHDFDLLVQESLAGVRGQHVAVSIPHDGR